MTSNIKIWVGIGAFTLVQAGAPLFDAANLPGKASAAWAAQGGEGGEKAQGEGGEGGEGGEAGIDADAAAHDPVVYRTALAVIDAHYLAGIDAYAAGEREAAEEMFAHPIAEVYVDLQPVLVERGVKPFEAAMEHAAELAEAGAPLGEVQAAVQQVLAATRAAAAKAPTGDQPPAAIEASLLAELIDRAALQYSTAAKGDDLEPYLDGYGFYKAAAAQAETSLPVVAQADAEAGREVRAALDLLAKAYPTAQRPANLATDPQQIVGQASKAHLALSSVR